jgi:hypothetical protein
MFGQFRSKKNPCNMRFMHYHSMHYDNFYCSGGGSIEGMLPVKKRKQGCTGNYNRFSLQYYSNLLKWRVKLFT